MAYPATLDNLSTSRGSASDTLSAVPHVTHHLNEDTAIQALQTKVGIDGSAVTTSHDYKLSGVTGTDKAVSKTGSETLTNKTLTSPVINVTSDATGDMYYRNSGGLYTRLPIGTSGQILNTDVSGIPAWVANPAAADASTTVKGVVELATQAETDAGTGTPSTTASLVAPITTVRARLLNTGVADTGSANAIAIAPSPAITAYAAYQEFTFKAAATNTGATTINVSSLGTKNVFYKGAACTGGEIVNGSVYTVVYDGTQFQMTTPAGNTPANSSKALAVLTSELSLGASTTETDIIANTSVAGNSLSSGRCIKCEIYATWTGANTSTTITFRVYYGGSSVGSMVMTCPSTGANMKSIVCFTINYVGASSQYIGGIGLTSTDGASQANNSAVLTTTSAVDCTAAQNVKITVQGSAGNTLSVNKVEAAIIQLI